MIKTELMEHQNLILDFVKDKKYYGIFADYGTGKTLCALSDIDRKQFRKALIVSNKTAIESTWPTEIKLHTDFKYVILTGHKKQKLQLLHRGLRASMVDAGYYHGAKTNNVCFLINFDGIKNIFSELVHANFDYICIDESTKIKSPDALRTKVLWAITKYIENRCIMTGFPITENINEIYSQVKFLDQGANFGDSYYAFLDKYFNKFGYRYAPKYDGVIEILTKIKPFCIRITNNVLKLPPKVYKEIKLDPSEMQQKLLQEFKDTFQLELGKIKIDTKYVFTLINKSLQICDGFIQDRVPKKDAFGHVIYKKNPDGTVKVDRLPDGSTTPIMEMETIIEKVPTNKDVTTLELVEEIDPRQNKILIWCNFIYSLKKLEHLLTKSGYKVLTLFGETDNKEEVVSKFQNDPKHNILIATQKTASASITLTNCRYVIYYSNSWSFDERSNSEARTHRKGSEKHESIIYTDLSVKGTIESKVIDCLKKKKNLIDELKTEFHNLQKQVPELANL